MVVQGAHWNNVILAIPIVKFIFVLQMFNKANVVGILIKAKKHGLVFFDGEIVFAVSS